MPRNAPRWTPEEEHGFQFSLRLRRSLDRMMDQANRVRRRRGTESVYQLVAGVHMNHAYVLQAGIHVLCRDGRPTAGLPVLRALLELLAGMLFIQQSESESKARRFIEFSAVLRYRDFGALSELPQWRCDSARQGLPAPVGAEIVEDYQAYCAQYCAQGQEPGHHWHGRTIRDLFASVGFDGPYKILYQPLCDAAHANVNAVSNHVVPVAGSSHAGIMINRGRTTTDARETLCQSCFLLIGMAQAWAKALQLGDEAVARLNRRRIQWAQVFDKPLPDATQDPTV